MTSITLETHLQEVREQLNLQAEAILKLVELVSSIEGLDATSLTAHVVRLHKLQGGVIPAPVGDQSAEEPALPR